MSLGITNNIFWSSVYRPRLQDQLYANSSQQNSSPKWKTKMRLVKMSKKNYFGVYTVTKDIQPITFWKPIKELTQMTRFLVALNVTRLSHIWATWRLMKKSTTKKNCTVVRNVTNHFINPMSWGHMSDFTEVKNHTMAVSVRRNSLHWATWRPMKEFTQGINLTAVLIVTINVTSQAHWRGIWEFTPVKCLIAVQPVEKSSMTIVPFEDIK